jgi:hypothetical protein
MMIAARREEHCRVAVARRHLKAQEIAIEAEGTFEIGDREMHVTYLHLGMDGV